MDDDKIQYLTRWLPENLSPNVKVVLSMINDTECHRLLRSYKSGPREITCGQLDYESRKVCNFVFIFATQTMLTVTLSVCEYMSLQEFRRSDSFQPFFNCRQCTAKQVEGN